MITNASILNRPSFGSDPEEALEKYLKTGFQIEPNVFSPAECDAMVATAHQLAPARDGAWKPAMNPHRDLPLFFDAMRNPRLVAIMKLLVGGVVSGLQSEFFFHRPTTPGFAPHQDNYFVEAPYGAFVSAWAALTNVSPGNGGLIMFPGSHREGLLPVRKRSCMLNPHQDPNATAQEAVVPSRFERVDIRVPKGSVVFIHGHVVHASHRNRSEGNRYSLLNTYIRKGEPFRPGRYAGRDEVDLGLS